MAFPIGLIEERRVQRLISRNVLNSRQQNLWDLLIEAEQLMLMHTICRFDKNFISRFLHLCRVTGKCNSVSEATRIYDMVVNILHYWNCQDDDIVADLLNTVCVRTATKEYVLIVDNLTCRTDYILQQSMKFHFSWWGWYTATCHQETNFDHPPVLTSLIYGRLNNLKILLKYGFQLTSPSNRQMNNFTSMLQNFLVSNAESVNVQCCSVNNYLSQQRHWRRRRSILVLEIFAVIYNGQAFPGAFNRFAECLQLVWNSVPDPYITIEEMYVTLLEICGFSFSRSLLQLCGSYRDCISQEDLYWAKPRNLKHLARCKVRDILCRNFQLPAGIAVLELPQTLRSYLRICEDS